LPEVASVFHFISPFSQKMVMNQKIKKFKPKGFLKILYK